MFRHDDKVLMQESPSFAPVDPASVIAMYRYDLFSRLACRARVVVQRKFSKFRSTPVYACLRDKFKVAIEPRDEGVSTQAVVNGTTEDSGE